MLSTTKTEKTPSVGIIDVGGGFRDIYGCGVLDTCMEQGIRFDHCIGVSAGCANLSSYLAGQQGRNLRFYEFYGQRPAYAGPTAVRMTGSFFNLDYVYSTLSNSDGEYPIDFAALQANPASFTMVACNARTGGAKYFTKEDLKQDFYDPIKASCAVPVACQPYVVDGVPYYDGGIVDPIPLKKLRAMGCEKAVLILTRPKTEFRAVSADERPADVLRHLWPNAASRLATRALLYNLQLEQALREEAEGRLLIVAPDDCCGVNTFTRDRILLDRLYRKGLRDGEAIAAFVRGRA